VPERRRIAIDTGAETSIARHRPCPDGRIATIAGLSTEKISTRTTTASIQTPNGQQHFDIQICPPTMDKLFNSLGVDALLGQPELKRLKIDVNHALEQPNDALQFRSGLTPTFSKTKLHTILTIHSRTTLRDADIYEYLKYIEGPGKSDDNYTIFDITFDDSLRGLKQTHSFQSTLRNNYSDIWQRTRDEMPHLLNPQMVQPHTELFKENATPLRMPPPKMSKARRQYWNRQRCIWLKAGMIRANPTSRWACIPHQVAKPMRSKAYPNVKNIRPVWNLARTNDRFQKIAPSYPHPIQQIYRILKYKYYFTTDLTKAFSAVGLAEGRTQEATSIWLPKGTSFALYSSTRLLLGGKNSATVFQNIFRTLLHDNISQEALDHTANFADDIVMAADSPNKLYQYVTEFMELAKKVNLKLNPRKTKFGRTTTFYGYTLDIDGKYCYSDEKLQNFMEVSEPKHDNGTIIAKELRSFLGVAIQMQRHVPNLATILQPLHKGTRKGRQMWTPELQQAFERTKKAMSTRRPLSDPDDTKQYHIESDASDAGMGSFLYQLEEDGSKRPISFFSKAFSAAERAKPTYYREAEAFITALENARLYMETSPFPLVIHTDQISLTWIFKSEKTKLTSWRLAKLMHIPVEVRYIRGENNTIADALSRRPILGQWKFATDIDVAMAKLIPLFSDAQQIWVYAANQTDPVAQNLRRAWNTKKVALDAINENTLKRTREFDVVVALPRAHDATRTASLLLASRRTTAILVPLDLIKEIQLPTEASLSDFTILVLASEHYAWIIHRPGIPTHTVCPISHISALADTPDGHELITAYGTSEDWAREYTVDDQNPYRSKGLRQQPSGLYTTEHEGQLRTIVPATRTNPLIRATHELLAHAGTRKTLSELRRLYIWPTIREDTKRLVSQCTCAAVRARHKLAHGNYRTRDWRGITSHWQIDFKSVAKSNNGCTTIMYAINSDGRFLKMWALPSRGAQHVLKALTQLVLEYRPQTIHSDNEGAMTGAAVTGFLAVQGVEQTFTESHHPESNGTAECVSAFINFCLRVLSTAEYKRWDTLIYKWCQAWNCTYKAVIRCSPFELLFGSPPNLPTAKIGRQDRDNAPYDLHAMIARINLRRNVFLRVAKWQTLRARHDCTERLNRGSTPVTYAEGESVFYYQPPHATRNGRRPKHQVSWYPGIVTAKRGTLYEVRDLTYQNNILRTVKNLARREPSDTTPPLALKESILSGEGIVIIWESKAYYAVIQRNNGTQTQVQIFGAKTSTTPDNTISFAPLYSTPRGLSFTPLSADDAAHTHVFDFSNPDTSSCFVFIRSVNLVDSKLPARHLAQIRTSRYDLATF